MKDGAGVHVKYVPGTYRPLANKDNDYLMDREAQKRGDTYSGVEGIAMQDASLQESMGPIVDRSKENLVSTDNGIIMARHRLRKAARRCATRARRRPASTRRISGCGRWRSSSTPIRPMSTPAAKTCPCGRASSRPRCEAAMSTAPTMLASCARAATAVEAGFRVDYPNSRERVSRIFALDREAAAVMGRVAEMPWHGAHFLTFEASLAGAAGLDSLPVDASLRTVDGREVRLSDELKDVDIAVMIATAGESATAAETIGNACFVRSIMTTGLIVAKGGARGAVERTVRALRPFAAMLVVTTGEEYIPEMLTALHV